MQNNPLVVDMAKDILRFINNGQEVTAQDAFYDLLEGIAAGLASEINPGVGIAKGAAAGNAKFQERLKEDKLLRIEAITAANKRLQDITDLDAAISASGAVDWGDEGKIINELDAEKSMDFTTAKSKYKEAEEVYRSIRLTMQDQSLGDESSTVFIREMVCKRKQHPKYSFFRLVSKFAHVTTGYGESLTRILSSGFGVIFFSALFYGIEGVSYQDRTLGFFVSDIQDYGIWATLGDLFYFSVITFTTVGFGEITPIGPFGKFLTIFEGLLSGIILTVFIIAMYRKMMDR